MCARRLKYPFIMDYMRPQELSVDEFHSFCKPERSLTLMRVGSA